MFCHFIGPVDAIAEFIDNSIQACMSEDSCRISCRLFIPISTSRLPSYLVVSDNGKGMDIDGIRDFATYSRTQAARGHAPVSRTVSGRMFIGKFGVGAKQAGFYLGNSITVLSRPKMDHSGDIYRFCLNEVPNVGSSGTASATNANHFQGVVEFLNPSLEPLLSFPSESGVPEHWNEMHNCIKRHFRKWHHGTVVIVKLLPDIITAFQTDTAEQFSKKLKDIYHFHLKQTIRFQDAANNAKFRQR
jgi:hypothetical protein